MRVFSQLSQPCLLCSSVWAFERPRLMVFLGSTASMFCTFTIFDSVIFRSAITTLFLVFAVSGSMPVLKAFVTLCKKTLRCISRRFVVQRIDEKAKADAFVCGMWVLYMYNGLSFYWFTVCCYSWFSMEPCYFRDCKA